MHIVRTEQSMRRWIVCGSPGLLFCSTGRCLSLSCLTTVRRCPQILSNASCFALGTDLRGIRNIVFLLAMALLSRYTTRKRASESHRLSETPIVWRNTSYTFTPRGLGYNSSSCELVKCFELKESDGELRCSCLRRQPAYLQPCARLVIFSIEEDLRGNTAKRVAWGVRVTDFSQT